MDRFVHKGEFREASVQSWRRKILLDRLSEEISAKPLKLMTSIAALQCVERGDLALDDPISTMLPEWTDASIIIGYDDELKKPILKPATNHITLRHLLTHSAGMAYANPMISPLLSKCADQPLGASKKSVKSQYFLPLVYEPGESWEYGPAIDWAGKMVERANDGMKLGEYLQKHVWDRLGMSSTTFRPMQNESLMKRMVERTQRTNTGTLVEDNSDMFRITELEDDFGGDGAYSCARDYILLLKSLLLDDEVLLGREMSKELFRGQLAHPSALKARMEHPILGPGLSPGLQGAEKSRWDYSCGGALRVDPIEGQSGQGLLYWSGITNSFWVSPSSAPRSTALIMPSSSIKRREYVASTVAGCCRQVMRLLATCLLGFKKLRIRGPRMLKVWCASCYQYMII